MPCYQIYDRALFKILPVPGEENPEIDLIISYTWVRSAGIKANGGVPVKP